MRAQRCENKRLPSSNALFILVLLDLVLCLFPLFSTSVVIATFQRNFTLMILPTASGEIRIDAVNHYLKNKNSGFLFSNLEL
jgi:hypothetical protein